jgi:hypothetical protein
MATTNVADSSFWDDISQLLGKTAAGAGSGRAAQGQYENQRDALAARLYDIGQTSRNQAANTNLATDKFRTSLPSVGADEAVRGALIQNAQPASLDYGPSHITRMKFSGGTTPASYTPETRAAGAALAAHGTGLLANPSSAITQTPGSGVAGADFLTPPKPSPELSPSFWEQAAGASSIGSGLMGALAKLGGGGGGGGGDLGAALKGLKKLLGGGDPGGIDNSGNTEDTRTEDMRSGSASGVAYGPNGEPLEIGYPDDYGQDPNLHDPYPDNEGDPEFGY